MAGDDWKASRLLLEGGVVFPALPVAFQRYWDPAAGWGIGLVQPLTPAVDFVARADFSSLGFDAGHVRRELGLSPAAQVSAGPTTLGASLVGVRLHSSGAGLRPFLELGVGLPDVSRPAVFYDDPVRGQGAVPGAEIFAFDPCYSVGCGIEYFRPRSVGGFVDVRLIDAPGRTQPAHAWVPLRAGISLRLPRLWPFGPGRG